MELDFNSFNESLDDYQNVYESLLSKTLKHLSLDFDPYISVTIVDNDYIHEINKTYRHKDAPTDVCHVFLAIDTFLCLLININL